MVGKIVLASAATFGLLFANPALAQSGRSGDALPQAGVELSAVDVSRVTAPMSEANELNRRTTPLVILLFFVIAGGIIALASGGDGNGNDSPG